jgi:hypothetical protein
VQIESFVLYHRDGVRRRLLPLHKGLNVITGWRNTGKSSLLEIVDYCFGRSTLTVSRGKVRRTVSWYGLVLRGEGGYAFAGRPAPRDGAASTSDAMWLPLANSEPPEPEELAVNTSAADLREQLSAFSRFADVLFDPPPDAARPPLRLHVGHVLPACLQDEEDIDSKTRLFHRGQERELMQALRDAMPYWIGAADEEAPSLRARLTAVNRELSQAERALARMLDATREADERSLSLLAQAAAVGLADEVDFSSPSPTADVNARLRSAAAADPENRPAAMPTGEVEALLARRRDLHDRLAQSERDEMLLRSLGADREAFTAEVGEQRARLASMGLLEHDGDPARCPVCMSALESPDPTAQLLNDHLRRLDDELQSVAEVATRDHEAIRAAAAITGELRDQLRVVNAALRDLADRDRRAAAARSLASRRAYVQGLISEFLRTVGADDSLAEPRLREQIATLTAERAQLEGQLDVAAEAERLAGAMNIVGADMTEIARRLELEHSEHGQVRLDLGKMTLVADTLLEGSFPLSGIGGAGTRVGYHLAAHLALHRLLRRRDRPGPAFVLFDHPTGPFYPDDRPEGEEPQLRHEDDRAIVAAMFDLLREVADDLDGALQIIVCDHARFTEPWFDRAMVENWRDGRGLIPDGWEEDEAEPEPSQATA